MRYDFFIRTSLERGQKKHKLEHVLTISWLIDKEKNMFVVHTGSGGDLGGTTTDFFELYISGEIIKFHATCVLSMQEVYYCVVGIAIPQVCQISLKDSAKIIYEALYALGFCGSWEGITTVHIKFSDHLNITE
jgi:hypothetical protein